MISEDSVLPLTTFFALTNLEYDAEAKRFRVEWLVRKGGDVVWREVTCGAGLAQVKELIHLMLYEAISASPDAIKVEREVFAEDYELMREQGETFTDDPFTSPFGTGAPFGKEDS